MAIIGIDISKAILDVCLLDASTNKAVSHCQVDNNPNGFDDLNRLG